MVSTVRFVAIRCAFLEYRFALRKLTSLERCIRRVVHARLTTGDANQFLWSARITSGLWISCCTPLLAATASAWCYPASAQTATPGLAATFRHRRRITAEPRVGSGHPTGGNSAGIDGNSDARHQSGRPAVGPRFHFREHVMFQFHPPPNEERSPRLAETCQPDARMHSRKTAHWRKAISARRCSHAGPAVGTNGVQP